MLIVLAVVEVGIIALALALLVMSGSVDSVSYTHLDVYKRQASGSSEG